MFLIARRALLGGAATSLAVGLAGCNTTQQQALAPAVVVPPPEKPARPTRPGAKPKPEVSADESRYKALYGAIPDKFPIAAVRPGVIPPEFWRTEVDFRSSEPTGTIVVDPKAHYLYYVLGGGKAMRYGVGVGKEGFAWSGAATINSKQEWADWYPPKEMIERTPEIKKQVTTLQSGLGVAGGLRNPLGARSMYLWQNNKDTLFRIHGTLEPGSIGRSVSSGCIRMVNQDVMDLYGRVAIGTKVVVLGDAQPTPVKPTPTAAAPARSRLLRRPA